MPQYIVTNNDCMKEYRWFDLFWNSSMTIPITISLAPEHWGEPEVFEAEFKGYIDKKNLVGDGKCINYYLVRENAISNVHYHGIIFIPKHEYQKQIQVWISNKGGKYKKSKKTEQLGWWQYIHKQG